MSNLLYFPNTINYVQQLTQKAEKKDFKKYIERLKKQYILTVIFTLAPLSLILSTIVIIKFYFGFALLLNSLSIAYFYICYKAINKFEQSQPNFLNMCQLIIIFEIKAKNNIQIGKYNSEFQIKNDKIIEQFVKKISELIKKQGLSFCKPNNLNNQWEIYLKLKPFLFQSIFIEFNESYCREKSYFNIYSNNTYNDLVLMLSHELSDVIDIIEKNTFYHNEEKSINNFLNTLENNDKTLYTMKRISQLLETDLNQTNQYTKLIKALKDNCNDDIKILLNEIIIYKEGSLSSFNMIRREMFPAVGFQKEPIDDKNYLENQNKTIISQGKSYSLFDLIISQRKNNDNDNTEIDKESLTKETSEKINLFELMKGEREVRGLKTSLIDELGEYYKKHKDNDELLETIQE